MPSSRTARTRIQRLGSGRARALRASVADEVRRAREDAGLSQRALARVVAALGMDLSVRLYPGTGPLIRERIQAAMIEALLKSLHERWRPSPEVPVYRPVNGIIDLLLDAQDEPLIACEALAEARPWPGESIVWCAVAHGQARIMDAPPRSVGVGR